MTPASLPPDTHHLLWPSGATPEWTATRSSRTCSAPNAGDVEGTDASTWFHRSDIAQVELLGHDLVAAAAGSYGPPPRWGRVLRRLHLLHGPAPQLVRVDQGVEVVGGERALEALIAGLAGISAE